MKHPHLGRSAARYEGEVLLIETVGQRTGILDTLGAPGLVQSDQMRTEEHFIPEGDRMRVVVTHYDPVYDQKLVVTYPYQRLPGGEIPLWDCTPEEAKPRSHLAGSRRDSRSRTDESRVVVACA